MREEMIEQYRTIDQILDRTEETIYGSITSPEDFRAQLNVEMLCKEGNFHVTKSRAKKVGASWPLHIHEDKCETIVVVNGKIMLNLGGVHQTLSVGQSREIPANILHGGYALTEDAEILSIVVPADEKTALLLGYLESIQHGRQ